jgi:TPR repeat protein
LQNISELIVQAERQEQAKLQEVADMEKTRKRQEQELKELQQNLAASKASLPKLHQEAQQYATIRRSSSETLARLRKDIQRAEQGGRKRRRTESGEEEQQKGKGKKRLCTSSSGAGASGASTSTADENGGTAARARALYMEGCDTYRGSNFMKVDEARGNLMIELAAANGDKVAVDHCMMFGFGGRAVDKAAAFNILKEMVRRGDAYAQFRLGVCYYKGDGVDEDKAEAVKWYRKAAEQGHATAQYNCGVCYCKGYGGDKDTAEAVKWYRKAAEQGDAEAQDRLAELEA